MGESLKTINIAMSVDAKGVSTGMKDAADAIKAGTDKIQTATETIATNTKKADESMRTLAQSYRSAFKDAQRIAESQGMQSQAFKEAAAKAGEYRNKLDDVKQVTQILSSDTPLLKGMSDVTKGLAGSVGAVSGAMAAFAGNNKTLQEWAQRSQGAISMLMGLEALGGLPDALKAMGVAINSVAVPALMKLWALAAANPITAIVSVLGAAAAAFGIYTLATEDSVEATKKVTKPTQDASKSIEKLTADLKEHNAQLQLQVAAKKAGVQVDAIKAKQLDDEIKKSEQQLAVLKPLAEQQKTNLLNGKASKEDYISQSVALSDHISELKAYQKALQDSAALQDKLDAKTSTKANIKTKTTKFNPIISGLDAVPSAVEMVKKSLKDLPTFIDSTTLQAATAWDKFGQKIGMTGADIKQKIADMSGAIAGNLAYAFGESLVDKNKSFGDAAVELLLNMFKEVGAVMISAGIAMELGIITGTIGAGLIAGGLALEALAGAGSAMMSSSSSSSNSVSSGSAVSGIGSSIAPAPNVNNMYLSGVLYGNDILISTKKSQQQYNRIK